MKQFVTMHFKTSFIFVLHIHNCDNIEPSCYKNNVASAIKSQLYKINALFIKLQFSTGQ